MLAPEPKELFARQTLLLEVRNTQMKKILSGPDETYIPVNPLRPWQRSPWPSQPTEVTRSSNTLPLLPIQNYLFAALQCLAFEHLECSLK